MTDEELNAIAARAEAATMWTPDQCELQRLPPEEDCPEGYLYVPQGAHLGHTSIVLDYQYEDSGKDWDFLAHARTDVPVLVAEVRRLWAEVEMMRGVGCEEDGDGPCGACIKCALKGNHVKQGTPQTPR
jgi:hypothetical protein